MFDIKELKTIKNALMSVPFEDYSLLDSMIEKINKAINEEEKYNTKYFLVTVEQNKKPVNIWISVDCINRPDINNESVFKFISDYIAITIDYDCNTIPSIVEYNQYMFEHMCVNPIRL